MSHSVVRLIHRRNKRFAVNGNEDRVCLGNELASLNDRELAGHDHLSAILLAGSNPTGKSGVKGSSCPVGDRQLAGERGDVDDALNKPKNVVEQGCDHSAMRTSGAPSWAALNVT